MPYEVTFDNDTRLFHVSWSDDVNGQDLKNFIISESARLPLARAIIQDFSRTRSLEISTSEIFEIADLSKQHNPDLSGLRIAMLTPDASIKGKVEIFCALRSLDTSNPPLYKNFSHYETAYHWATSSNQANLSSIANTQ